MPRFRFKFREGAEVYGTATAIAQSEAEAKEIIIDAVASRGRVIVQQDLISMSDHYECYEFDSCTSHQKA